MTRFRAEIKTYQLPDDERIRPNLYLPIIAELWQLIFATYGNNCTWLCYQWMFQTKRLVLKLTMIKTLFVCRIIIHLFFHILTATPLGAFKGNCPSTKIFQNLTWTDKKVVNENLISSALYTNKLTRILSWTYKNNHGGVVGEILWNR